MAGKKLFFLFSAAIFLAGVVPFAADAATATRTFYSSDSGREGIIRANSAVYSTARDSSSGNIFRDAIYVGQMKQDLEFYIWRSYLYFDTSSLPDGAEITSAKLFLATFADSSFDDFDIILQNGQPTYPRDPLLADDFDRSHYSGNGGSLATVGLAGFGFLNELIFNADGLAWINKTGWTKLALRSSKDISGAEPAGNEYVHFSGSPRLEITISYSPPNVSGFAWSENIGWISFNAVNCDADDNGFTDSGACGGNNVTTPQIDYGVNIDSATGVFSGYAWSPNIGWISFEPADLAGCPGGTCEAKTDLGTGEMTGWARALAYGDGWDGWIKFSGTAMDGSPYGVSVDTATGKFSGYAWSDMIIGWIHMSGADYEVVTDPGLFVGNSPPTVTTESAENWEYCKYRQSATGPTAAIPTFSWTFSDVDGDSQQAYEIRINDSAGFPPTPAPGEFTDSADSPSSSYSPPPAAWSAWMHYGPPPYKWIVRVQDDKGNWSDWSSINPFNTPNHAFPWIDFQPSPATVVVDEVVTFIQDDSTIAEALCYDGGEHLCQNDIKTDYAWDFTYVPADGFIADSTKKSNTSTTYSVAGLYEARLKITDSSLTGPDKSCAKSRTVVVEPPLPEYIESPPAAWITRTLASAIDLLKSFLF